MALCLWDFAAVICVLDLFEGLFGDSWPKGVAKDIFWISYKLLTIE